MYFLKTQRLGFSFWDKDDLPLATLLWGDKDVCRYICKTGCFLPNEIKNKLAEQIANQNEYLVQYWPLFDLQTSEFVGCCGLRPNGLRPAPQQGVFEIGFHLRKKFWGKGLAYEAATKVIDYAFNTLNVRTLFAGHNPNNINSKKVLAALGFNYICDCFYPLTQLMHPLYQLSAPKL